VRKLNFKYIYKVSREDIMKNKLYTLMLSVIIGLSPVTGFTQSESAGAAGGVSAGTAVAIGIVGAALLVALSDSSSSAAAGVNSAGSSVAAVAADDAAATTTTTVAAATTTTAAATTTTTTN
jgi:hypothetical protein